MPITSILLWMMSRIFPTIPIIKNRIANNSVTIHKNIIGFLTRQGNVNLPTFTNIMIHTSDEVRSKKQSAPITYWNINRYTFQVFKKRILDLINSWIIEQLIILYDVAFYDTPMKGLVQLWFFFRPYQFPSVNHLTTW